MSRTKLKKPGGDQKRKAERRAAKAEAKAKAKAEDTEMADATTEVKEKQRKEEKAQRKATKEGGEEDEEKRKQKEEKAKRKAEKAKQKEEKSKRKAMEEEEEKPAQGTSNPNSDSPEKSSKKRKRTSPSDGDLEIDVSAPEPPSKKALRKLKKHPELAPKILKPTTTSTTSTPTSEFPEHSSQARSKFGIWIGNLSFSTTPVILTDFLAGENKDSITRINLPLQNGRNKGFAYVDFKTESALQHALSLSESLLGGRRVLIKNAKDFSNRPSVATAESTSTAPRVGANLTSNPPSRILYVGNLEFSCTAEHLKSHFSFAGNIQKVRLATFEDTERCKGFGFVDFEDKESVKRAMLGLTPEEELVYEDLEGKEEVALHSLRKKRGILNGRPITMEYGEDPSVRYKKRFGGKDKEEGGSGGSKRPGKFKGKPKEDTRSADAGAVYSRGAESRTGAITQATGQKMSFED